MEINFNGKIEDISMILLSAERYALGRQTYIVQWTCEFMIRDIGNKISYGDECDKECLMQLLGLKLENIKT